MTMRSAPAPQPSERPKISFVFPVHDPDYGGGLLGRTQRHVDALIALANRYRLSSEIIIVEWNPRQDRARFRESLRWSDDLGYVCLRFIEVPGEIHRTLPNSDQIPIFEYIAKNAGLRRARGQFLLATNPDLFYSPALIRWLARAPLSPENFYRVDRLDLSEPIPADFSLARQLRFCSQHVALVNALFGSYRPGNPEVSRRLKEEYDHCLHDPARAKPFKATPDARLTFPADGLHRNASGDFFLMEREQWHRLRGYPELYTHAHIDAILCWVAASAGLVQELLPPRCHLYHQAHGRESRAGFPQTDKKPWYEKYREAVHQGPSGGDSPLVMNLPDWGLANEILPEWQVSSRLVQVVLAGEANGHERQFDSSLAGENAARTSSQKPAPTETSLAAIRSQLRHAQAGLDAAGQKEAALRLALRKEQSAREAEREAAEKVLRKSQRVRRTERAEFKAALREAQAARRSEAARRHMLESSIAWRVTWPTRRLLAAFRNFRQAPGPSVDLRGIEVGGSGPNKPDLVAQPKKDRPKKVHHLPADAREASDCGSVVDNAVPATGRDAALQVASLQPQRPLDIAPLQVFTVPGDEPRVSIVSDKLRANSPFNGADTALAIAALLARQLDARLRVITLTEPPDAGKVGAVLTTHGMGWTGDVEFVHVGPERQDQVSLGDDELFLTTSWTSTRCVLPLVAAGRLVYLLQEDERVLTMSADDRERCVETLSDPRIQFVIKSRQLFDRLTQGPDALPNILANGAWFDAALPASVRGGDVTRDWEAAVAPVLARLDPVRRSG